MDVHPVPFHRDVAGIRLFADALESTMTMNNLPLFLTGGKFFKKSIDQHICMCYTCIS
jgi:hypothetical protein